MLMTLTCNGNKTQLPDGMKLTEYLSQNGYRPEIIAVELNLQIVPKASYDSVVLKEGDSLEVVSFMGGG